MTVPTTFVALRYNGAGVTGPFSVPYQFGQDAFLRVRKTDTAGNITTLILNADYTVTGAGLAAGGNVTLTVALAVGEVLEIDLGGTLLTQATDYVNGGKVDFETLEDSFDNRTLTDQWLQQQVNRTVRVTDGTLAELPGVSDRASMVLGFDAGGALAVVASTTLGAEVFHEEEFTTTAPNTTITLLNAPAGDNLIDVYVEDAWQGVWTRVGQAITLTGTPAGLSGYVKYYERLPFYQAVGETIQSGLRYGISNTSTASQTAEFQAAIDNSSGVIGLPPHNYVLTPGSLTGQDRSSGAAFLGFGATINGTDQKHGLRGLFFGTDGIYGESYDFWLNDGFSTGVNDQLKSSLLTLTAETDTSTTSDGTLTKTALQSTVNAMGAQHGNAARFNLYNYSTFAAANTCVYAHAVSDTTSIATFALHGETRHAGGTSIGISSESASYSASGSFYGLKVENTSGGGAASILHEITGSGTVKHDLATGILMSGTAGSDKGEWRYGIRFRDGSLRAADGEGIRFEDSNLYQIHSLGVATADIYLQGDSATGIILGGAYTSGNAIRVNAGQAIAWEGTGSTKTYFDSGTSQLRTSIGGTDRIALEVDPSPRLLLNSTQVLRERITGWTAMTGTAARGALATYTAPTISGTYTASEVQAIADHVEALSQRVKAMQDDQTTHGLIGA